MPKEFLLETRIKPGYRSREVWDVACVTLDMTRDNSITKEMGKKWVIEALNFDYEAK